MGDTIAARDDAGECIFRASDDDRLVRLNIREGYAVSGRRVWLIDRIVRTRSGLRALLQGTAFQVTDEFSHIELIDIGSYNTSPDLILATMEILADGGDALPGLRRIRKREPNSHVVAFDKSTSAIGLGAAMKGGASAYLESEIPGDELIRALELVAAGEKVLPLELVRRLLRTSTPQAGT